MRQQRAGRARPKGIALLAGIVGLLLCLTLYLAMRSSSKRGGVAGFSRGAVGGDIHEQPLVQCISEDMEEHVEYWGDVVTAGADAGKTPGLAADSALNCCMACKEAKGCNIWVWCSNPSSCGQQCWLKRVGQPSDIEGVRRAADAGVPWTSGVLRKDYDRSIDSLPPVDTTIRVVSLSTPHGVIRIRLMPDWSASSVEFVQRLAMTPDLCSNACEFYRAEPGFLLQGSLRAFIPPNKITTPGPKIMERGELGWAGGSAGPDFFIYLGQYPATHFGHDHTVFAVVADDESLAVVETIVQLPSEAPHPGDMHMLNAREPFSIGVAAL